DGSAGDRTAVRGDDLPGAARSQGRRAQQGVLPEDTHACQEGVGEARFHEQGHRRKGSTKVHCALLVPAPQEAPTPPAEGPGGGGGRRRRRR
ncbi:unnamed protein product, partial [Discosporangium mesarthrocarpum]